ncbi:MAG: hypothetical protein CSA52_02575 [Gammaproteobacteria bacterium]|nr:MAG: hypothetical protein CSB48_04245 [Pseudomonadota bacterium]PIE38287.1 MAG: hypothetical protein CSA52_02575 [Gammaproteobacteria bacterium]
MKWSELAVNKLCLTLFTCLCKTAEQITEQPCTHFSHAEITAFKQLIDRFICLLIPLLFY